MSTLEQAAAIIQDATSGFCRQSYALEGLQALQEAGWTIEAPEVPSVMERLRRGETFDLNDVVFELEGEIAREPAESTSPRPQWANVAKATRVIDDIVSNDPALRARADALGAYVRDTWDALGLSLYDEDTLYVAMTMAGMFVQMADNGRASGLTDERIVEAIAKISQCFAASVLDYLPPEVRR